MRTKRNDWLAIVCCVLVASSIAIATARSSFVACVMDCGETFIALHQVDNFRIYGLRYGLLEDHAVHESQEDPAFLYTHNVNLGSLWYIALEVIGVGSMEVKQLATIVIFALGLLYAYLAVSRISGSQALGLVALALLATEYRLVLAFATNALRAWHWIALFGLLFHAYAVGAAPSDRRGTRLHFLGLAVCVLIAFGIGYEFYFTAIVCAFVFSVWSAWKYARPRWTPLIILAFLALVPPVLRQLQVLWVLGTQFWWTDVSLSLLAKMPWAATFLSSAQEPAAFYEAYGILRPPAQPIPPFSQWWPGAVALFNNVFLPVVGIASMLLTLLVVVGGILLVCTRWVASGAPWPQNRRLRITAALLAVLLLPFLVHLLAHRSVSPELFGLYSIRYGALLGVLGVALSFLVWTASSEWLPQKIVRAVRTGTSALNDLVRPALPATAIPILSRSAEMVGLLAIGMLIGLLAFAPFSFQVYLKHQFPLLIAPIVIAKASALFAVGAFLLKTRVSATKQAIAACVGVIILVDHAKIQYDNYVASSGIDLSWMRALTDASQSSVAVSWIPSTVALFTDKWAIGIAPGAERAIANRARRGTFSISETDVFLAGPAVRRLEESSAWPPDFWLYFPTDSLILADRESADCRWDYLTEWIRFAYYTAFNLSADVLPNPSRSDRRSSEHKIAEYTFRASIPYPTRWLAEFQSSTAESAGRPLGTESQASAAIAYNCLVRTLRVTIEDRPGQTATTLFTRKNSKTIEIELNVPAKAPSQSIRVPIVAARQPTPEELIQALPMLRVEKQGTGYVLFDLRPLKGRPVETTRRK